MERPAKRARLSPGLSQEIEKPDATISTCTDLKNDRFDVQEKVVATAETPFPSPRLVPSPFQLTYIRDLPDNMGLNEGTVKLRDILGDPLIKECWQFNYCFDVDFLMAQFDPDVRNLVKVKVVHGSWEKESANRMRIDEASDQYPNVETIIAYMPERFGTHHSKMMVILRHDDLAQIVILTANMIPADWTNMTQAVWRSPLLPLLKPGAPSSPQGKMGTGARFKRDLLSYLKAYGTKKTGPLVSELSRYDFSAIRAALIASVPSKQQPSSLDSDNSTLWGWPALKDVMERIPITRQTPEKKGKKSRVVIQISSVATLGVTDKWLSGIFFKALTTTTDATPKYSIIFPTPDEIRRSLDGYNSGGSIHMRTQGANQQKQLQYVRPYLCRWANDSKIDLTNETPKREAGRGRAAPHIKTYIRFSDEEKMDEIDWAMVTSANLSTQAWGAAPNASGEVRISSFEIGVVVWPELYSDDVPEDKNSTSSDVRIVPCFKQNQPDLRNHAVNAATVVGLRMPYSLPLSPYGPSDQPWCASASHSLPDWRGMRWVI